MRVRQALPSMASMWIEAIGLVAGIIGIFAWIPQINEVNDKPS